MRRFLTYTMAVLVIITFIPLGEALAKDLCVSAGGNGIFIFKTVKPLTKPGQFSPLNGIWLAGFVAESAPFHGAAYVRGDGTIDIGLWTHFTLGLGGAGVNFSAQLRGSTFDTASGSYDNGPDGVDDGILTFVGYVDCRSLTLP